MNPEFYNPLHAARTLGDRCIVSAATEPAYFERMHATRLYCHRWAPEAWQLFYYGYPDGCPTQAQHQYAFKIHALRRPVAAGFRTILWMDTAFQPVASMQPLWDEIETNGWYVPAQGSSVLGRWCSDAALDVFGIDRDAAMNIPLVFSGLVGFRIDHPIGREIWDTWERLCATGCFDGPHYNAPNKIMEPLGQKIKGWCSNDPRCEGHRHDEAALSFILWKLGLEPGRKPWLEVEGNRGFIGYHRELQVKES